MDVGDGMGDRVYESRVCECRAWEIGCVSVGVGDRVCECRVWDIGCTSVGCGR